MGLELWTYAIWCVISDGRLPDADLLLGERWKIHRRMFHRQFQASAVSVFWPVQLKEAHKLMRCILHEPNDLIEHLRL
jgi:hypothetical protein